ncbi:hypothetical protein ACS0TY_006894 [Phlomoides rotata]
MEKNENQATKKEPNYRGVRAMPFVIGNETFEKLGTIGISANLLVYLTTVFNMKSITATNVLNVFNGTCNFGTVIGAFLSDTYLGRYKTLGIASVSSFLGMLILTLTAAFPKLHPVDCGSASSCADPSPWQLAFLFSSFTLMVIGASGIRPCNLAFGADQFNPNTESGKRGINSFFNWYFFTYTFAMMVSLTIIVYVQASINWAIGCLNKGAILTPEDEIMSDGSAVNPWSLRSVQQIEEIKCVIKVIPIWFSGVIYFIGFTQSQTYPVFQAIQTDRRFGSDNFKIPAASYNVFMMMSLSIWIPIYDRVLVPLLRKMTRKEGGITMLQRMGVGIVLGMLSMLLSGVVENHRRTLAITRPTLGVVPHKGDVSSMSGNLLIPQLAVAGLAEAFFVIGLVEFFYKQFPENMRSFGGSFMFLGAAMASYLSSFLISIVHKVTQKGENSNWLAEDLNMGKLDNFYYLVAVLQVVNLGYFLVVAKWYKYKTGEEGSSVDVTKEKIDSRNLVV